MAHTDIPDCEVEELQWIMANSKVGYLAIVLENGFPRVIPVDFVFFEGKIYFHGALHGEKFDCFMARPKVSFSAVVEYSIIPTYWSGEEHACRSNHFYKSVLVYGCGSIVEDTGEKAEALQRLMGKYQPEGGFRKISADDPFYEKSLQRTAIFRVSSERFTLKINLAQGKDRKTRLELINKLEDRNQGVDKATAEMIRGTLKNSSEE